MYFAKNWHDIREEWVTGLTFKSGKFLNTINNRLESFNSKLKSVILFFSKLSEFLNIYLWLLGVFGRSVRKGLQ